MDPKKFFNEPPVRRIYVGDVPFIYDDREVIQKVSCESHRCFRFASSKVEMDDRFAASGPIPVTRQSMQTGQPASIEKFPDNSVISSRYTVWNFLPKNLFEQFRRLVNFYFLVGALIHASISSPVHPITAVSPLTFVVMITAIKQGYEDWLRHKSDDIVNNRPVKTLKNGILTNIKSKDILVGDIILLEADEQVPTDILLLGSSDEFLRCQINTANLDGETNLKLRYCPSGLPRYKAPEDFHRLHVIVECEHPCEDLYEFSGSLLLPAEKLHEMLWSPTESIAELDENIRAAYNASKNEHIESLKSSGLVRQGMTDFISIPLSMDNMVLRGTRLKNTDYIYGLVIYTGRDTRLARNSETSQAKFSTVERAVNVYLVFFICLLILMITFCSLMHFCVEWYPKENGVPWYMEEPTPIMEPFDELQLVLSFMILFNYIIPISLYVTIELQKFLGSKFFEWDNDMVDEEGKEPLCNTSDLNEELGQIDYLFSDKTGTLTQNLMQFRHCSIEAVRYEFRLDENLYLFKASNSKNDLSVYKPVDIFGNRDVLKFFRALALCHSVQVVPRRTPSFDMGKGGPLLLGTTAGKIKMPPGWTESMITEGITRHSPPHSETEYQASSPDEKALLESCEKLGIVYVGEKEDILTLHVGDQSEKYKRLMQLEFDSDRKCMSVIVENSKGEIWLYSKGAESSITPRCDEGPCQETLKHVMDYALMGLRTLVVAERKLTPQEYEQFTIELRAARRHIKNMQDRVRQVYSNIETHMTLIGATGVEDQLQENVVETLQSFAAAGIRVWMLTGDKLETGINVAVSCGLITASTKQYVLSKTSNPIEIKYRLEQYKEEIDPNDNTCFVIDGETLAVCFKECAELVRDVSMKATRVVCCRMAPLQKAQVVQMVKTSPLKPTCCAVGDGANDCAMILAAHIGIGILGKEGRQAARCADFALAKFGYLRKAILVHGHWYYVRLANLANYFFYKNIVFVFPQFFFCFDTDFSTQAIFNGLFLMNFNIFFSSCPIFVYGLTEQPYSAKELLQYPQLYKNNRKNALMTVGKFIPWLISGLWHAGVCYYLTRFSWGNFDHMNDISTFGTIIFTGVVIASNNKMLVETKFVSLYTVGSQLFSYITFAGMSTIFSEVNLKAVGFAPGEFRHVFFTMVCSINFWLLIGLITIVAIFPDLTVTAMKHSLKQKPKTRPKNSKEQIKIH